MKKKGLIAKRKNWTHLLKTRTCLLNGKISNLFFLGAKGVRAYGFEEKKNRF